MKIGVSAFAWTAEFDSSLFAVLPALRDQGIETFEIGMFDPTRIDTRPIRHALANAGLECTVCAILPSAVNPISPDRATRRSSVDHLKRCIQTSSDLGANLIAGPLYSPIGYLPGHRRTQDEWTWAVEVFSDLVDSLEEQQVTLAIEPVNRHETFFLRTAAEAVALCQAVAHPRVGITIDTFHANIEERNLSRALLQAGPHLKHIHASENDRGLLGSGHVDFPGMVDTLRKIHYTGRIVIEGFGYRPEDVHAPGFLLADTETSPEQVAYGGAEYLRSLF